MTALQRLLKYPHAAVFDKTPQAEPVLRLRSEAGLAWQVADEVLSVTSGDRVLTYGLAALTVGQLAAQLQQDGLEVGPINPEFAGLSAAVLVEGHGDQAQSNGDRLTGFKSLLWSLYSAYGRELREARTQVGEALRQMVIWQSEGEWLDLWGALYNTPRLADEDDAAYQPRIPQEAFRIRVNALAIEQAIKDATGKDVRIEEPWGSMFRLDESALSGEHKFYDGERVGYHLIRPVSRVSIDWSDVLPVIDRNRAAGVVVLDPETRLGSGIDATLDGTVWLGIQSISSAMIQIWTDSRLDYMVLSDEEITRNWDVMISNVVTMANLDPLLDPVSIAAVRNIAMASITLSEGPAFGDENFVFPRAELTQQGGEMIVSDNLELSSPDQKPVFQPVDLITSQTNASGELVMGGAVEVGVKPSVIIGRFVDASINGTVSVGVTAGFTWATAGSWDDFPWDATQYEMLRIESVINRFDHYANTQLGEDL